MSSRRGRAATHHRHIHNRVIYLPRIALNIRLHAKHACCIRPARYMRDHDQPLSCTGLTAILIIIRLLRTVIRVETPSCFDDLRARGPPHPARPSSGDVERGCVVLDLRELRNSDISIIGNSLFSDFRFLRAISRRARICDLREGACLPAPGAVPRGSGGPRPVTRVAGGVKFTCYMQLHVFTLKRPRT